MGSLPRSAPRLTGTAAVDSRRQQRGGAQGKLFAGDLVRPGIYLYGGAAGSQSPKAVAAFRARVVAVRSIAAGDTVGYGATWRAERPTRVATVGVGYADGFPRASPATGPYPSPRHIELNGKMAPLVGRVTMDMCMAAVGEDVAVGDVATVFGGLISLDQQAEAAGTISYELLTRLGPSSRTPLREVAVNPHFASLILGLSHQAEAALSGELPPGAEGIGNARQLAQTLIDTLGMLADKTSDRLDPDEKQLLDQALTALRFRFVQTMPKA